MDSYNTCPDCNGSGQIDKEDWCTETCTTCNGTGKVEQDD